MYSDISESKIDEISKDTLGSYVKRAASDLRTKSFNRGLDVARNRTDPEELEKDAKKVDARHTGIMKAASRLQNKS